MFAVETMQDLEDVIADQKEYIGHLNKKMEDFESVVRERDDLRELYKQFGRNNDEMKIQSREVFEELLSSYEIQTETLKKVALAEYQCELRNEKLEDEINDIKHELTILKCNENKLQSELADSETSLKCVQNELSSTKLELEEKNRIISKLKNNFKDKEQELHEVSRELDECKTKCNKLNQTNENLNMDLKATHEILRDTKSSVKHMEETFKLERGHLSNELEISNRTIDELEMRCGKARKDLNEERRTIKTFYERIKELNKTNEKTQLETKKQLQKLHDSLHFLKEKIDELERENDTKSMEIKTLKNKLSERECQLKKMSVLSEKINKIEKKVESSCTKNTTKTNTCCRKENTDVNICCRCEDCTTHMCCDAHKKTVIQKEQDSTKPYECKHNIHKTILKNLICELETLLHNSFKI